MITILQGDVVEKLKELPEKSVHCTVTSPPYYGLRNYGVEGQIGLEKTPEEYVQKLVEVFREVKRALRDDGTLWLNLGDSYWGGKGQSGSGNPEEQQERNDEGISINRSYHQIAGDGKTRPTDGKHSVIKPKDMIGIPWRVAFALQADGWYLRSDIIWNKPNPMPESVTDRPTKSHEYIFLLTKNARYFYDADAIREPSTDKEGWINRCKYDFNGRPDLIMPDGQQPQTMHLNRVLQKQDLTGNPTYTGFNERWQLKNADRDGGFQNINRNKAILGVETAGDGITRNARTVWTITTQARPEAHFATFPDEIPRRCISAGCPANGTVLDPFGGSGTTGDIARELKRDCILIELNPEYIKIMKNRLRLNEQLGV